MTKTFFQSENPFTLFREVLKEHGSKLTKQQRLSMSGEVDFAESRGDNECGVNVLKGLCRLLGFDLAAEPFDRPNSCGYVEHCTKYKAGIPTWENPIVRAKTHSNYGK